MGQATLRRIAAEAALVIGIASTIFGGGALMATAGGGSPFVTMLASLCVVLGISLALVAVRLHRRSRYLFLASFMIQSGAFLLLVFSGLLVFPFSRLWPLLALFAGLSLIPAGWHRYGAFKSRFVVPASGFVILSVGFLLFSFEILPFSFKSFILAWWPLLLILAGILLMLISFSARSPGSEEPGP